MRSRHLWRVWPASWASGRSLRVATWDSLSYPTLLRIGLALVVASVAGTTTSAVLMQRAIAPPDSLPQTPPALLPLVLPPGGAGPHGDGGLLRRGPAPAYVCAQH